MANKAQVEITAKNNTNAAFKEAEATAKGFAETVKSAMGPVLALLGAATIGDFFKHAIEESIQAQKNFTDMSVALRNVGADAQVAIPQIQTLVEDLALRTGKDTDQVAAAMNRLITSTGDYHKAMLALPTVLDVATARNIDLESASTLVAKAFNGNETALKKLGIAVKDGQTPFDALRASYKGFADEEGKTFAGTLGRLHEGWRNILQAVGDAIVGNDAMSGASETLVGALKDVEKYINDNRKTISDMTTVVIQLGKWLGWLAAAGLQLVVEGFKYVEASVIAATAGFKEIPEAGKLAFGGFLSVLGDFVSKASGVLDKFGIHFADGVGERLRASGQAMMIGAREAITSIDDTAQDAISAIYRPSRQQAQKISNLPPVPKDLSAGAQSTQQKDREDKEFREKVAGLTALLQLDDKRTAALAELNNLAAQELRIVNNKNLSEKERVKAAERYGMVIHAIQSDETTRFNDSLAANKALLDLDDKRSGALDTLNVMAEQQLAIANDLTVSDHDRLQAQARYKQITDAIRSDDEKHFKDQLDTDKAQLQFADKHVAVMTKLRTEAEHLKAITLDTSKTDKERVQAAQRLEEILSATGGKLHLAMTGTESFQSVTQALADMADEGSNLNNVLGELAGTTLVNLSNGLGAAFAAIGAGQGVFDSLTKAAKKSVADAAKNEGQLEIGRGMAALATGTWPPNPLALAAAGKHFAAGAFLSALGGALGGSGGNSGGGGSGGASAGQNAGQTQSTLGNNRPTGTIVIQGGLLNMNDPKQADAFADAINQVTGQRLVVLSSN